MGHSHRVQQTGQPLVHLPCAMPFSKCHFGSATPEELAEWINYGTSHTAVFFNEPPKAFPQWLEDYRKGNEVDQRARIDQTVAGSGWPNMNDYPDATLEMPAVSEPLAQWEIEALESGIPVTRDHFLENVKNRLPGVNWEKIQAHEEERNRMQGDFGNIVEEFARSGMTPAQIQQAITEGFHETPTEVLPRVKASFNAMLDRNGIEGSWDDQEKSKMGLKNFNNEPYEPVSDEVLEARNRFAASITNRPVILADDEDCVKTEPEVIPGDNQADYLATAKRCVREVVDGRYPLNPIPHYDVYIVWFCKTIQNWKALVGTTLADGMYYEVTRNGNQNETYVDIYHKIGQSTLYD